MTLTGFDYTAPETLAEAVAALAATAGSRPLAGGQSVLNAMKLNRCAPALLVDLRRIAALHGVDRSAGGGLRIGALCSLTELAEQPALRTSYRAVQEAAAATGDRQLRNVATVGGALATRRAPADLNAAFLMAEATLDVVGSAGARTIAIGDPLGSDEIIASVWLPPPPPNFSSAYEKVADRATLEPVCGVAAGVALDDDRFALVRLAVTGARQNPIRLIQAERALLTVRVGRRANGGPPSTERTLDLPVSAVLAGSDELYLTDDRASAQYRANLTRVLAVRALTRAVARGV